MKFFSRIIATDHVYIGKVKARHEISLKLCFTVATPTKVIVKEVRKGK